MKKIVTIGGGTGTFVVLSGLRDHPCALSAIVSVADDGGSTGRLRDAYGSLPQGDIRQALVALSEAGPMLRKLFLHRFVKGDIAGHNFGNLYLTALSEILGSDHKALLEVSKLLKIKGQVIPVSDTSAILCAAYSDGSVITGQSNISASREGHGSITRLFLKEPCSASLEALEAIHNADLIVLGPGDLYTSTLANFVIDGLAKAVAESSGKLVYVMNLFTTPESRKMTMQDYVTRVTRYATRAPDEIIVNSAPFPAEVLERYAAEQQYPLIDNLDTKARRYELLDTSLVERHAADAVRRSLLRHDPNRLADVIMAL